jgi:hypothetical protein
MPRVDRRHFLVRGSAAVAAGLVLAACTGEPAPPPSPAPSTSPTDPDDGVRAAAAAAEARLIAAYRDALAAAPALGAVLRPVLAHHEAHLASVAPSTASPAATPDAAASTPSTSGSPSEPSEGGEPVPGSPTTQAEGPAARLRALAELEARAVGEATRACNGATHPALARVLCLIAASEAQHAEVLGDAARRAGRERP